MRSDTPAQIVVTVAYIVNVPVMRKMKRRPDVPQEGRISTLLMLNLLLITGTTGFFLHDGVVQQKEFFAVPGFTISAPSLVASLSSSYGPAGVAAAKFFFCSLATIPASLLLLAVNRCEFKRLVEDWRYWSAYLTFLSTMVMQIIAAWGCVTFFRSAAR